MFDKLGGGGGSLYRKNKIYEHISQQQMQNTVKKRKEKSENDINGYTLSYQSFPSKIIHIISFI